MDDVLAFNEDELTSAGAAAPGPPVAVVIPLVDITMWVARSREGDFNLYTTYGKSMSQL